MVSKKQKALQRVNKSEAGRGNAAVPQMIPVTRWFMQILPDIYTFADVVPGSSNSQLGLLGKFAVGGMDWALKEFVTPSSGIRTTMDQYRFEEIQVFAYLDKPNNTDSPVFIVSSVDFDDAVPQDWEKMSQRTNTKQTILTKYDPYKCIGKFKPRGNFVTTGTDSPSNIIPKANAYWDMANMSQLFNGLKFTAASQEQTSIGFTAKARVSFRGKI